LTPQDIFWKSSKHTVVTEKEIRCDSAATAWFAQREKESFGSIRMAVSADLTSPVMFIRQVGKYSKTEMESCVVTT
jgi:hypothetical protein